MKGGRRYSILLVLALYQFLFAPLFAHVHVFQGSWLVHVHPYAAQHDHSDQAYRTIDLANHTTGVIAAETVIPVVYFLLCGNVGIADISDIKISCIAHRATRAPPVNAFGYIAA